MTKVKRTGQAGFTVIELLIASSVFAVVLLVVTIAILQIGRTYYKGITATRTQETARAVVDEISQAIQFGGGEPFLDVADGVVCAGGKRFSFVLDQQVTGSQHALRVEDVDACEGQVRDMSVGKELLNTRMRLASLNVAAVSGRPNLYRITVRVVSGDNAVLNGAHNACATGRGGTQFCAVSELSTTVQRRL